MLHVLPSRSRIGHKYLIREVHLIRDRVITCYSACQLNQYIKQFVESNLVNQQTNYSKT